MPLYLLLALLPRKEFDQLASLILILVLILLHGSIVHGWYAYMIAASVVVVVVNEFVLVGIVPTSSS